MQTFVQLLPWGVLTVVLVILAFLAGWKLKAAEKRVPGRIEITPPEPGDERLKAAMKAALRELARNSELRTWPISG